MKALGNIRIGVRLIVSFLVVAIIAGAVGFVGIQSLTSSSQKSTDIYHDYGMSQGIIGKIAINFNKARQLTRDIVLITDKAKRIQIAQDLESLSTENNELLPQFQDTINTQETQDKFDALKANLAAYRVVRDEIVEYALAGKDAEAVALLYGDATAPTNASDASIVDLFNTKATNGQSKADALSAENQQTSLILIGIIVAGVLLAIGLGVLISASISRPISKLVAASKKLAIGDTDIQLDVGNRDEVGMLSKAFQGVVTSIRGLIEDADMLSQGAMEGRLSTRADSARHQGDFRKVIEGVNGTLDAVINPLAMAANYVDRISKGDIPKKITEEYPGDFNDIKNNLNTCIEAVNLLVRDANMLSDAAIEGRLEIRADAAQHSGDFRKVVEGVNQTLNTLVGHFENIPAPMMILDKEYNIRFINKAGVAFTGRKDNLLGQKCRDLINSADCRSGKCACALAMQTKRTVAGETLAYPGGEEREISYSGVPLHDRNGDVIGVFKVVTDLTDIKKAAHKTEKQMAYQHKEVTKLVSNLVKLSSGDFDITVNIEKPDEDTQQLYDIYTNINGSLMQSAESVKSMAKDITMLAEAAVEGRLSTRADAAQHLGGYRTLVEGVNRTLDSVIDPLNVAADYVQRISRGDIPAKITDGYRGDFNTIKNNLNTCIDAVNRLILDANDLNQAAVAGRLLTRADATRHQGDFRRLIEGINGALSTVVGHIDAMPTPVTIMDTDMKVQYINKTGATLTGKTQQQAMGLYCHELYRSGHCNTENCACAKALRTDRTVYSETDAHPNGVSMDIGYSGVPLHDDNGKVIGVLEVVTDMTAIKTAQRVTLRQQQYQSKQVDKLSANLERMARGELRCDMEIDPPDADTQDIYQLFSDICRNLHQSFHSLKGYIDEITSVLTAISAGNLDVAITSDFDGDFVSLKDSLNNILNSLNEVFGEVNNAAEQVAGGTRQVSDGSQALSQGATEQASAIEELTASVSEIAAQTRQNALNAGRANELSVATRDRAITGNNQMQGMLAAMTDINDASANISRIIKVIDDIAFQTNLLALNAAVEAARAGQHGKGFAVVAEEVRNLAARSANAAKETTVLIENSIQKVQDGMRIANDTAQAFGKIVDGVEESTKLVSGIASASNDQATAVAQVNRGIEQVSQVVQTNSATAEESAATSEELSGQAEMLKEMVARFNLKGQHSGRIPAAAARQLPQVHTPAKTDRAKISLREKEFGKY